MKRSIALPALLLIALLGLVGCESETSLSTTPVDLDEASDVALIPEMPEADEGVRDRRRMDIPQLDAAMQVASGGIGWTEIRDGGEVVNLFERLAPTLGVPDYIERMSLDLTPSVVFEKFLGDASRSVCSAMVGREMNGPGERILMKHVTDEDDWESNPSAVDRNMRYLLLRFHGRNYITGDQEMEPWLWLFRTSMHDGSEPPLAWHTICVALYTHPDFYSY